MMTVTLPAFKLASLSVAPATVVPMTSPKYFSAPEPVFTPVVLDASQSAVLEIAPQSSARVLGAAGTGKTATLIELVARRVETDGFHPDQILVLSPVRQAANRLRLALAERLHVATNGPLARTPMSLAFSLAYEGALARGVEPPSMLTGSEQDAILSSILELPESVTAWPEDLGFEVRQSRTFRTELRDLYARCLDLGWGADQLEAAGRERGIHAWVSAAAFWRNEYEPTMADLRVNHFDIATLLRQATVALAEPAVMGRVRLVVVDDAQELTRGAANLVRAFASRGVPVVLFGNPDVSATTFRGADPTILGALSGIAAGAEPLVLKHGHRQSGLAASLADQVTGRIGAATAGQQRSARPAADMPVTNVSIIERNSVVSETRAIARALREHHIYEGIPFSKMAVVVRSGGQVSEIARVLAVNEVPTRTLVSGRSLREQSIVRDLLRVLNVALGRTELTPVIAADILLSPLCGLTIIQVRRMRQALRHDELAADGNQTGAQLLARALHGEVPVEHITMAASSKVAAVSRLLADLRQTSDATIEEQLWKIWSWSKLAKTWGDESRGSGVVADEANRNLDAVLALFTAAKRFVEREPHAPASKFVTEVMASDVPEDTLTALAASDSVVVCTPAAVIGEEFDVIVVASVQEGRWPNLRPRGSLLHAPLLDHTPVDAEVIDARKQVLDDELRMFALAITRARTHVILSATAGNDDAPSPFIRLAQSIDDIHTTSAENTDQYQLSLRAMVGHLRRLLAADLAQRPGGSTVALEYARAIARLSEADVPGAHPQTWYGLAAPSTSDDVVLTAPTDDRTPEVVHVSPSSLEKWEKNQLGWFIDGTVSFQGSSATGIGTLIHEVFEKSFHEPEMSIEPDDLWQQIAPRWAELGIEPAWLDEREQRRAKEMLEALSGYLSDARKAERTAVGSEVKFELPIGDHAVLKGSMDRIEKTVDGLYEIIDLKTGKYTVSEKDTPKHIQLACYQFAARAGALAEIGDGDEFGGAKLLFLVNTTVKPEKYTVRQQGSLPAEGNSEASGIRSIEEIGEMLQKAASQMGGGSYTAIVYSREEIGQYDSRWNKRIHVIQGVSA